MPDKPGKRPCTDTLENCNSLSASDALEGKLTDGKLVGTFRRDDLPNNGKCAVTDDQFFGLHFDLPEHAKFEHGQILIVMTNARLTQSRREEVDDAKLLTWPPISLWGEEQGKIDKKLFQDL